MKGRSREQKKPSRGMPGRPAEVPIHRQAVSFLLLPGSSAARTPENSPVWSEGVHFPNLQGHRREGASREPLSCQRGESHSAGEQPLAFDQLTSYCLAQSVLWLLLFLVFFFFMQMRNASNAARKYLSYGYHVISRAFNMGTFTAKDFPKSVLE